MTLDADIRLRQGNFLLEARFTAPDGITVLFGPSGGGKSTLLSALAGLKSCQGHIRLGSRILADSGTRLHVASHRRGIGLVFQDARLFPHLTVGQNLAYAHARAPVARRSDVADLAHFFEIAPLMDRSVGNLSGGEKSRVALARALASAPDYLLLDEPFAALDGMLRHNLTRVLLNMHRTYRLPMMVITHNVEDAAALGSHLLALRGGRIVASGPVAETSLAAEFKDLLDRRDTGVALPARMLRSRHGDVQSLWLRADHVLLAMERPQAVSARNILEGTVLCVETDGPDSEIVRLETRAGLLLSRVTSEAVLELGIAPGRRVWALIKAHTL